MLLQINFDVFGIFANVNIFLFTMILTGVAIGAYSRKLSIAVLSGLLIYVYIVIETDLFIFDAIMYLVLTLLALWVGIRSASEYLAGRSGGEM